MTNGLGDRCDVIVVGDAMLDVSVEAGTLARGGDVHGRIRVRPAGAGANAAVWAASDGCSVRFFGRVGKDPSGRIIADALSARGVVAALAEDPMLPTGSMLVLTEGTERSMVADRGANSGFSTEDLETRLEAESILISGYLLFDPGSAPACRAAIERARARWIAIEAASWPLLDRYGPERFFEATAGANLVLANEREATVLTGKDLAQAATALADRYGAACVKRGAGGAIFAEGGTVIESKSQVVNVIDTTGAGDAFDGVLLSRLARGTEPAEAVEEACRAGARAASSEELWPG